MTNASHISLNQLTRRDFLKLCGASSVGFALAACGVTPTPTPTLAPTNTVVPTNTLLPTATPTLTNTPAPTSTATPTATSTATATATPQTLRDFATTSGINFLVSLPEWYFKDNRRELGLVPQNFNGINAQGLYLLWQKPSEQWTDADLVLHDKTLRFALDNRMTTRMGQHLAWGHQAAVPSNSWLRSLAKDDLIRALQTHIGQVVKRYQDINVWCVVNEPREGFWGERFGQDISWMQEAFNSANRANSETKRILNDFGIEIPGSTTFNKTKRDAILQLGKSLKDKNVPISGIGFQMHVSAKDFRDENRTAQLMFDLKANIKEYQQVFGEVIVTELDARMDDLLSLPEQTQLEIQARAYQSIIASCLDAGVKTICVFGVSDRDSWLKQNTPLLFDATLNPKPAYFAILKTLQEYYAKQKPK